MCIAAGMDDYVSKPIRVEALVEALARSRPLPVAQPPGPPAESALDPEALRTLLNTLGGDFALLDEVVSSLLEDAPRLLIELRGYLEAGNAGGVHRIAHSLKSNGLDVGAGAFAGHCRELEALAKTGSLDGAGPLLAAIEADYASVDAALRRVLAAREIA